MPNGLKLIPEEQIRPGPPITRKGPTGPKPVIPTGDTCCANVCRILNNEISAIDEAIGMRGEELKIITSSSQRLRTRRQVRVLTDRVSSLKDLRYSLKDNGSCTCIE